MGGSATTDTTIAEAIVTSGRDRRVSATASSTIVCRYMEGWSWVDSFYFSAVAGSSVGYGDLTPATDRAKLFTVRDIFSSPAILGTFLNVRLKHRGLVRR